MQRFFTVSAVFNFGVVLAFVFAQDVLLPLFGLRVDNSSLTFMYFLMVLIALYGLAYLKIAKAPLRYRELILFGAQAKLSLVVAGIAMVFAGLVLWPILIPLSCDLVFAGIFTKIYRQLGSA